MKSTVGRPPASFIGKANFVPANVVFSKEYVAEIPGGPRLKIEPQSLLQDGSDIDLLIRPENIQIANPNRKGIKVRLVEITFRGASARIHTVTREGLDLLVKIRGSSLGELSPMSEMINFTPDEKFVRAFPSS